MKLNAVWHSYLFPNRNKALAENWENANKAWRLVTSTIHEG